MKFSLKQRVMISDSEHGEIQARAEYVNAEPSYLVRYLAADGRMVEQWWAENSLTAA